MHFMVQIATDFNGDGLTDIMALTLDGLYGWAQVRDCQLVASNRAMWLEKVCVCLDSESWLSGSA